MHCSVLLYHTVVYSALYLITFKWSEVETSAVKTHHKDHWQIHAESGQKEDWKMLARSFWSHPALVDAVMQPSQVHCSAGVWPWTFLFCGCICILTFVFVFRLLYLYSDFCICILTFVFLFEFLYLYLEFYLYLDFVFVFELLYLYLNVCTCIWTYVFVFGLLYLNLIFL